MTARCLFPPLISLIAVFVSSAAIAQTKVKSPAQRLRDLEDRVGELEEEVKDLEKEAEDKKTPVFSDGILTLGGGVELKLGGKVEIYFIATQNERDPAFIETTNEPDPHVEFNRLRLAPRLRFNRHISARGQLDFRPDRTELKEFTADFRAQPVWWFSPRFGIGLDDRFIRPTRRTRTYPLLGNAFWRDESVAATLALQFGDARGKPTKGKDSERDDDSDAVEFEDEQTTFRRKNETLEVEMARDTVGAGPEESQAFDFADNWGQLTFFLSAGNGYALRGNEVGFDNAAFNDLVQDDRNLSDLTLSELGIGVEYERDFAEFGVISFLAFLYHDRLSDTALQFLQTGLTVRDNANNALFGYGDSSSRDSSRYGFGVEYFLPAESLFGGVMKTDRRDGLRLHGQWIEAEDGSFERRGWYGQASYRFTFPKRLIADRYLRSIEPLVRYGRLDTNIGPFVDLPGTWDREQLLLGLVTEITGEVFVRVEYTFRDEDTGGTGGAPSSVANDDLLVELLLIF